MRTASRTCLCFTPRPLCTSARPGILKRGHGEVAPPPLGRVELGFEEAMMTVAELARQLLIDAPSDALCDSCLALACGATLVEMRQITKVLLGESTIFRQDATCASCRRTVAAIVYHHT
jgi:hypothetical protein